MNELVNEKLNRFIDLLKGIFELDKSDLDFGIYRIMNIRKNEIEKFLNEDLPKKVEETLAPFASNGKDALLTKKAEIEQKASDLGIEISASPKLAEEYESVKRELASGTDLSALETDVYSALYSFFNRYYDDGDFISKRRYKEGVYAIPYEGEEVKLYWANQDQYYIKTSENFKDYVFTAEEWTIHFNLVDATTEQNNNKETDDSKRVFMLFNEDEENYPGVKTFECDAEKKELIIRFIFDIPADKKKKSKQDKIQEAYNDDAYTKICEYLAKERKELISVLLNNVSDDKNKPLSYIQKHLKGYVAKNTFDYFIHNDLGGFLSRELDFFIKNEVMHLDDLDTSNEVRVETYLAKVKAIKKVGKIIIDFLAQIENFQKKLWLKKKFVVETNWCITLDKIDESFYEEIRNNKEQVQEWIDMYAIDEIVNDVEHQELWTNPPSIEFLKQNKNLLIDTKNFSESFKEKLVATIDGLDEITNGLMINGDNFHVLNLLQKKLLHKVNCSYIDPPYNAKSSEILYKNTFKDSAWLSLMNNRINLASNLLSDRGVSVIAIDEVEQVHLGELLKSCFPYKSIVAVSVVHNPSGQQGKNFSFTNEFAYFIYDDVDGIIGLENRDETEWDTRTFRDNSGNSNLRTDAANCFYPIFVKDDKITGFGNVPQDDFHPSSRNVAKENGVIEVWPIDNHGVEKKWVFEIATVQSIISELWIKKDESNNSIDIMRTKKRFRRKTTWTDKKYSANSYGSAVLTAMNVPFSYPKSIYNVQECVCAALSDKKTGLVLDYFAGSGTTGHAVMLQNYLDHGNRKFVLGEMGSYFEKATKTRVKKAAYAVDVKSWKNGKPLNRNTGISQIIKYMKLESYEDALSNIVLEKPQSTITNLFGDEYLINYMMDIEAKGSLLNVGAFKSPFEYQMKITEKNESKLHKVDVVETFNYLVGLTVVRQGATKYYSVVKAKSPEYEGAVELANDSNGKFAFRQIEGVLPDGRRALIIWRNVGDDVLENNAALDAYFTKYRINPQDREFDVIYVNGDNNLENLKTDSESWKVQLIETEFNNRMFEEN